MSPEGNDVVSLFTISKATSISRKPWTNFPLSLLTPPVQEGVFHCTRGKQNRKRGHAGQKTQSPLEVRARAIPTGGISPRVTEPDVGHVSPTGSRVGPPQIPHHTETP